LSVLGKGGMGTVYRALHKRLEKLVALKILSPDRLHDQHAIVRFEREMKAIGKVRHPRIVAAHDAGEVAGAHFLVMELIEGIDLSMLVRHLGPLPIADACELASQAAEGLAAINDHGLVHRDIKPSNLMLTSTGEIKVLDLGLALLQGGSAHTQLVRRDAALPARLLGTADYLAPEQARDSRSVDIRADFYSLGCSLVELLTGEPPYPTRQWRSIVEKIQAHCTAPLPDLRQRRSDLPLDLVQVLERLLAKKPSDRFQTPTEVMEALRQFTAGANPPRLFAQAHSSCENSNPPKTQATVAQDEVQHKRKLPWRWRAVTAAILVILLAIAAYTLTGEGQVALHLPEPSIEITIDGRPVPADVEFLPQRVEHHLRLPVGHHNLQVSKPGFHPFATSFWLLRDRRVLIDVPLIPISPTPRQFSPLSITVKSGTPIATTSPLGAWELSVRANVGKHNDIYYVPVKSDWEGAGRIGQIEDAIFWGPFAEDQPDSIWIFRTYAYAETAISVEIFFGHDDGAALYLNEALISSSGTTSGRFGHLAFTGPVQFKQGWNKLEMAVYVAQGASSINLGAIAPQYKQALSQVSGITVRADTPASNISSP
jgi:serine/threonine protein kinase